MASLVDLLEDRVDIIRLEVGVDTAITQIVVKVVQEEDMLVVGHILRLKDVAHHMGQVVACLLVLVLVLVLVLGEEGLVAMELLVLQIILKELHMGVLVLAVAQA